MYFEVYLQFNFFRQPSIAFKGFSGTTKKKKSAVHFMTEEGRDLMWTLHKNKKVCLFSVPPSNPKDNLLALAPWHIKDEIQWRRWFNMCCGIFSPDLGYSSFPGLSLEGEYLTTRVWKPMAK